MRNLSRSPPPIYRFPSHLSPSPSPSPSLIQAQNEIVSLKIALENLDTASKAEIAKLKKVNKMLLKKLQKNLKQTQESAQKGRRIVALGDSASPSPYPYPSTRMTQEKFHLIRNMGEEWMQEEELWNSLAKKPNPIWYDHFDPSGRMHIAQGVMKTIYMNKLTSAGCKVRIWIADGLAQLNNEMGGDLTKIHKIGEYLIEIWRALGMDQQNVEFVWSSDEKKRPDEYWVLMMDETNFRRSIRCSLFYQTMGRSKQDDVAASQILNPCMQSTDIFFLKGDICQLGMDQRKVNVLARENFDDIKTKYKPIILSHYMLPGLQLRQEKMSKSNPTSLIFMEDDEAQVNVKIKRAYCPPKIVEGNPCIEYIKYIVFPWFGSFEVSREEQYGGNKVYTTIEELIADYLSGHLHPCDFKPSLSKAINKILQPVRDHFKNDSAAKELLKAVKGYTITL